MNQQLRPLSLFPGEPDPPPRASGLARKHGVWLAVRLIDLALQAWTCSSDGLPLAVVEESKGQLCIHAANARARELGIGPGLRLSAALAISDGLQIVDRSVEAERSILRSLAISFQSLTPIVSIEPPDAILLELRASLKLFGGIQKIKDAVAAQADKRRLSFDFSVAPTASGALWLVRHGRYEADTLDDLTRHVRSLPLHVTAWPETVLARLREMGISTLGDCLRLPRDGFAKRAGASYLRDLDKALGREIELRAVMELPRKLAWRFDFPSETAGLGLILDAAEYLTERLVSVLRKRQMQIRRFSFRFHYLHRASDSEDFELLDASHEGQRICDLFSDRLARLNLPAPVIALELKTGVLHPMQVEGPDFFRDGDSADRERGLNHALIERLQERLGPRNVHGIALAADHRPESAWCESDYDAIERHGQGLSPWAGARPLWLLRAPCRLMSKGGEPLYNGLLQLRAGPERIESGWWDQREIARDYYTAVTERGERLWIYQDGAAGAWYLHGVFG